MQTIKHKSDIVIVGNLKGGSVFKLLDRHLYLMVIDKKEDKYVELSEGRFCYVDPTASVEYFPNAAMELNPTQVTSTWKRFINFFKGVK